MDKTARVVGVVLAVWLAAAIAFGLSGVLQRLPARTIAVPAIGLTLLTLAAVAAIGPLRRWVMEVDLRVLVALHVTRFVGIAFLIYARRGLLPEELARSAAFGDIAVAITALLVLGMLSVPMPRQPRSLIAWNLFGLVDIVMVLWRGMQAASADPESMRQMTLLPLSLLPTFLVPLIIATHVILFVRIWRMRGEFAEKS